MDLREATIKLANDHPELRKHLVPLLQRTAGDKAKTEDGAQNLYDAYKKKHPDTKKRPQDFYEKPSDDDKPKDDKPKDDDKKPDKDDKDEDEKSDKPDTAAQIKTFKKTFDPKDFNGFDGWVGDRFPNETAEDINQPGQADEAVKYWVDELGWNVKPEDAREYLLDAGIEDERVEELSDSDLNEYTLWLAAGRQGEEDYEDSRESSVTPLRQAAMKLAADVPEMRKHLVPILKRTAAPTTKKEWQAALKGDVADLKKAESDLKTLEKGGKVQNLTLPNAKQNIKGLKAAIVNKKKLISKMASGDEFLGGRGHSDPGKGYGMTGPDVRGPGDAPPKAKGKCFYETGDEADRCYTTENGGPNGARGNKVCPGRKNNGPAEAKKCWKKYEKARWG